MGTADLAGRSVAVIGLGHVGGELARGLAAAGARLVVSDVAPGRRALADELGAAWAEPAEALRAEVDVVAPCALGGVLDHDTVPALRCRAVAGAANNQLASDDLAADLHARGVLWVPDFVANAGGIINIAVELEPDGYAPDRARDAGRGDRRDAAHHPRHGRRRGDDAAGRRAGARPPPHRAARRGVVASGTPTPQGCQRRG